MSFHIGFTGTRYGMNERQRIIIKAALTYPFTAHEAFDARDGVVFHHGDCIGADAEAYEIAHDAGLRTVSHPSNYESLRSHTASDVILPPKPALERNEQIIRVSNVLFATPRENEERFRSGTWTTIRYARKAEIPHFVFLPNNKIQAKSYGSSDWLFFANALMIALRGKLVVENADN